MDDLDEDLYDKQMRIVVSGFIRPQLKVRFNLDILLT